MENNNFISKSIWELKLKDGSKINKPDAMLIEMWLFYSKSYAKLDILNIEETSFIGIGIKMPKLNEIEQIK